jgi:LysM repeat protein
MNSIRPLVTITILVVVGAYLYVKINEGPVAPASGASRAWDEPQDGVPPLGAAGEVAVTSDSAAPTWPGAVAQSPSTTQVPAPSVEVATPAAPPETLPPLADVSAEKLPAVPAIPEMPQIATTAQVDVGATPSVPLPTELPANIPTARYPDQPATNETGASIDASANAAPPESAVVASVEAGAPITDTTPAPPTTPEQMNAASAAASNLIDQPLAAQPNPLRQSSPPTSAVDRYATEPATTNTTVEATAPAAQQSFAASWPTIQAALDRGELAQAHQQLTQWYGDPSLTPTDAERVETLLGQLAGTVVYSTEHQLAPAHVVKPGETLDTIAKQYNVPWQLLAKINGVAAPDQVRAGQELKVVPGPFSAVVDANRKELVLTVGDRYAGKFPVTLAPGQTITDGQWVVDQKLGAGEGGAPITVPQFISGNRVITLRGESDAAGTAPPTLTITSEPPAQGAATAGTTIQVSAKDAEEISDILSVGSRVVTRR